MIGEVTTLTTPTQYLVFRVTPSENGWGSGVALRAYGTDSTNNLGFEHIETFEEGTDTVVLRLGPFVKSATAAITITLRNADDEIVDSWIQNIVVSNPNSPAVIVRQAVYDIVEDAGIDGAFLLTDGLRRPASAAEDMPFVIGNVAVEIGPPSSRKSKKTAVRSEVTCEIPITVYVFGFSTGEAFAQADNVCWQVQSLVDATPNLYLSGLGVNNFSWVWSVSQPEVVDVQGSHVPVVVQEMTLSVPVIWVTAPPAS